MKIRLPASVKMVLDSLMAKGYEAYAVGGCVRDSILGKEPDDWDITTSARPEQVKEIFRRTVDTGIAHGTVTVLIGEHSHEVTTYRIDGKYADGRHPDKVDFTASLEEDLKRRDFTINAMAYNEADGLVDLFDGCGDLNRHVIRCVGCAMERFSEDALRILRAIRFSAQLDFRIEKETYEAIRTLAPTLSRISAERICTEMMKLLVSDHPDYFREAYESGVTKVILPEFDLCMETPQNTPYHLYSVGEHTLHSLKGVEPDRKLRLTMLLHDIAKPYCKTRDPDGTEHFKGHPAASEELAGKIMRRLKLDNDTIRTVRHLIRYHDWRIRPEAAEVRKGMSVIGPELFDWYLKVQRADEYAKSEYNNGEALSRIDAVERLYRKILEAGECVSIKELAINGSDLMKAGIPAGPVLGELLKEALEQVLADPSRNVREKLLECCLETWKQQENR